MPDPLSSQTCVLHRSAPGSEEQWWRMSFEAGSAGYAKVTSETQSEEQILDLAGQTKREAFLVYVVDKMLEVEDYSLSAPLKVRRHSPPKSHSPYNTHSSTRPSSTATTPNSRSRSRRRRKSSSPRCRCWRASLPHPSTTARRASGTPGGAGRMPCPRASRSRLSTACTRKQTGRSATPRPWTRTRSRAPRTGSESPSRWAWATRWPIRRISRSLGARARSREGIPSPVARLWWARWCGRLV